MPLPRSPVAPSTQNQNPPPTNAISTTTPPEPTGYAGTPSFSSPSPRKRLTNRDFASPSGNSYHHRFLSLDSRVPAAQPAYPNPHVESAATANRRPSYTPFPPEPLTPTLLLPPEPTARETSSACRDTFNESTSPTSAPYPVKELEPPRASGRSRSSSAGALSDSFRNLNRWSASTTSSRTSTGFTSLTKRISIEVFGGKGGSPKQKSHRSRPSTSSLSPRQTASARTRPESPPPAPVPPLQSLPQISIGPSLEEEVRQTNVLSRDSPIPRPRFLLRPSDDTGLYWDGAPQIPEDNSGLSSQLDPAKSLLPAATITPGNTMPYTQNGESRGHSRNRSNGANGSTDTNSSTKNRDRGERDRGNRGPSQRTMLSKALQKANTAVELDNAQNTEGARRAYSEACNLLQQVLERTSAEEDRKKLEAIYTLYMSRISDLDEQFAGQDFVDKELPRRPESGDNQEFTGSQINRTEGDLGAEERSPRSARDLDFERDLTIPSYSVPMSAARRPSSSKGPPGLSILSAQTATEPRDGTTSSLPNQYSLQSAFSRSRLGGGSTLQPHTESGYMPPPLSPRRPPSPAKPPPPPPQRESPERPVRPEYYMTGANLAPSGTANGHKRGTSHESISWLDPIDESGGSSASSVHSRSSSLRIRRKHIRAASGDTEAEFDAALDDAIEAAYDDGFEPETQYGASRYQEDTEVAVANTLRRVELARERVRESEREALVEANEREKRLRLQQQIEDEEYRRQEGLAEDFYDGNSSEDEERMLEEMTNGYVIEDFAFAPNSKPSVPRESDSSGLTSRTWHSSMGSNPPTATTVLTTVSENTVLPQPKGPVPPPPTQPLPQLPPQPSSAGSQGSSQSVRNRRLSGQNPKQLKIETTKIAPAAPATAGAAIPQQPRTSSYIVQQRQALSAGPNRTTGPLSSRPSVSPAPGTMDGSATPPLPTGFVQEDLPRSGSPSVARPGLRKNFSSSSLRSMKSRNLSVSHIDDASDLSPGTPLSNQYGIGGSATRLPALPSIPTPLVGTFRERSDTSATGGLHLFDNGFHSPSSPGSPNLMLPDAPAPLEPCPNDVMLRPFWLMRCLYQTLCHPRGGYLSNKLFVPREVWRVKGVKLKNVEDKIANCDYLTAALQKLGKVDTCDADAVLEEMQALEGVLEQVQATLTRKLGSEVGVHGTNAMFKDASAVENDAAAMLRSASVSAKSSSFSWRRLRSKNSSANLPNLATSYGGKGGSGGASTSTTPVDGSSGRDILLPSLPMTTHPTSRPTKRDIGSVYFSGPNANYMSSLARLFDAAQSIDQIARQVEDPGLRHADKTQVGLELCTRHAAEFFGFYVCRFVLSDLTMMLDKFVKRGSEWVLV
ncbi:hypothetical protein B0H66DRAFT_479462 [Apodospora peruviana]|uniref:MIT domain-containing protein n=1 Tax=Apodospora peruviana TaxID=516989 RepID=A0AAE0I1G9_9PEZI|nr:hypothetical protein B0H66DRAFT_479462 [Apodospora peruviana]